MGSDRSLRVLEFCQWVFAASASVVVASLALGFVLGGDLLTGKYVLFVVGFLLFGVGTLMLQPTRPHESAQLDRAGRRSGGGPGGGPGGQSPGGGPGGPSPGGPGSEGDGEGAFGEGSMELSALRKRVQIQRSREHRYEAKLVALGPLSGRELPFERRIGRGPKVFLTGLVVLGVSLLMEIVGVQI